MKSLPADERRALRAKAHRLHAVVSIGQHGLTPSVLHEIDVNLLAHELIKVRVFSDNRDEREALLARICEAMDAAPVQHIGKMLVLWRAAPKEPASARPAERTPASRRRPRSAEREQPKIETTRGGNARARVPLSGAKRAPQARRPRNPTPRQPARPPQGRGAGTGAGTTRRRGRG